MTDTGIVRGYGTGIIIKKTDKKHNKYPTMVKGLILTCFHVTPAQGTSKIIVRFKKNGDSPAVLISADEASDVALLESWVPEKCVPIKLANKPPKAGDVVRMCGFGHIKDPKKPRYFEGTVWRSSTKNIVVLEDILPGDSGGSIVNEAGELVGMMNSGRMDWLTTNDGVRYTSPLSGPAIEYFKLVIERHEIRRIASFFSEVHEDF